MSDIPLYLALLFIGIGLVTLAYSSDIFICASAKVARRLGISPFIVGMVIIGFGTSAPELCVSVLSGLSKHSELSLGNAYGSCVFNIAAILGVSALITPLVAKKTVALVAGPVLAIIALLSYFLLCDNSCSRIDAAILIGIFIVLLPLYCWFDQKYSQKGVSSSSVDEQCKCSCRLSVEFVKIILGLLLLVGSSHLLVWGAVDAARSMGISELFIGLTIVAIGTSLPELASAVAAARRGEHEFVLGNIVGSNFFNTLAVVGFSSVISPAENFSRGILTRDLPAMVILSLSITLFAYNFKDSSKDGRIGRKKAFIWLFLFVGYTVFLLLSELQCIKL